MAFDETLAARIRTLLPQGDDVTERKMFGGIAFMVGGNMAVGVTRDDLMVRIRPDAYDETVTQPHARPMDFTGRSTRGMVYVGPDGTRDDRDLERWVAVGVDVARSLPPK